MPVGHHGKRLQPALQQTSNCHRSTAPANWLKTKAHSAEIPSDEPSLNSQERMNDVLGSTTPCQLAEVIRAGLAAWGGVYIPKHRFLVSSNPSEQQPLT